MTTYIGESSRTGHARGNNHLKDLLKRREGKPLWVHSEEEHRGELKPEHYKMKLVRKYRTPLQRQIGEALEIGD